MNTLMGFADTLFPFRTTIRRGSYDVRSLSSEGQFHYANEFHPFFMLLLVLALNENKSRNLFLLLLLLLLQKACYTCAKKYHTFPFIVLQSRTTALWLAVQYASITYIRSSFSLCEWLMLLYVDAFVIFVTLGSVRKLFHSSSSLIHAVVQLDCLDFFFTVVCVPNCRLNAWCSLTLGTQVFFSCFSQEGITASDVNRLLEFTPWR